LRELGVPMAEDSFVEFYMESNWAKPMLAEALQQFEVSLSVLSVMRVNFFIYVCPEPVLAK
jgi:hypothetical protein